MGIIPLEPPDTVEAKRATVEFQHSRHFVLACNNCHHTWDGSEPVTGCMTSGCHDLDALPRKEGSKAIDKDQAFRYYKNAYHGQCIGCHKIHETGNSADGKDPCRDRWTSFRSLGPPAASAVIPKSSRSADRD